MQEDSFFVKHSRSITIISIVGIIFCILLVTIIAIVKHLDQKTYLTVQFAPATATLHLTNQPESSTLTTLTTGTYELPPGTYTGTLTAKDFEPKDITITIDAHQVNNFTDYLTKPSEGLDYFEQSASDIATLRGIKNDPNITNFLETYDRKASLYELLPLTVSWLKRPNDTPIYTLTITNASNHPQCQGPLCLLATGPNYNQTELANALAERGYDINNYEVFYEYSAI